MNLRYNNVSAKLEFFSPSLGAYHDGTGDNLCQSSDQYIMAPFPGEPDEENKNNIYTFSDCSVMEFRNHLNLIRLLGA